MIHRTVDLVVIGSGPAGLAAAIKARESVEKVVVVERDEAPGGLLHQCIHNGFGLVYFREDLTGPEYAGRFIEKADDLNVELMLQTMALEVSSGRVVVANRNGITCLHCMAIVLAMGCRERTRPNIGIGGTRPAGIFTAGTAQRYVNIEGFLPGKQVVILGSGDVGMIMARRLTLEGVEVKVVEKLPYVGGLIRNEVQCLVDFDIPLMLGHTVTEIHGRKRIEGVTIAQVDSNGQAIKDTGERVSCDTLLLSVGLIPENELSVAAGVELDPLTGGPLVDETMETNVYSIFAAGNVVHVNDLVDNVTLEGELAGINAAEAIKRRAEPLVRGRIHLRPGKNVRYVKPDYITGEKEISLSLRVSEPMDSASLRLNGIFSKSFMAVRPSEMVRVNLSRKELGKIKKGTTELVVNCEERV